MYLYAGNAYRYRVLHVIQFSTTDQSLKRSKLVSIPLHLLYFTENCHSYLIITCSVLPELFN